MSLTKTIIAHSTAVAFSILIGVSKETAIAAIYFGSIGIIIGYINAKKGANEQ